MDAIHVAALLRSVAVSASRRSLLAFLSSGLLATGSLGLRLDEAGARKSRHHKRKKHRRRKKRDNAKRNTASQIPPVITADATCSEIPDGTNEQDGNARLAQTFTALGSGPLVRADLLIVRQLGEDGDYVLRLSPLDGSGVPTNAVLAETAVANAAVPLGETMVSFTFATPFSIVAGTQYALVLTRPGGVRYEWHFKGGDACPGQSFSSPSQIGQFSSVQADDFIFTVFVSA